MVQIFFLLGRWMTRPMNFILGCTFACLCWNYQLLAGPNNLYPEDLIPFTRYPLFLVIDSENSHAFKAGLSELNLGLFEESHYHSPWAFCCFFRVHQKDITRLSLSFVIPLCHVFPDFIFVYLNGCIFSFFTVTSLLVDHTVSMCSYWVIIIVTWYGHLGGLITVWCLDNIHVDGCRSFSCE
jgi:hypothetical protein